MYYKEVEIVEGEGQFWVNEGHPIVTNVAYSLP